MELPSSWPPCVGKGGSEQRAATSFPGDPRDPGMNSKSRILYMFLQQKCSYRSGEPLTPRCKVILAAIHWGGASGNPRT